MSTNLSHEKSIANALERLGDLITEEFDKLNEASDIPDFERRGKMLNALTKSTQNIRELVNELKTQANKNNDAIGSVVEFREELARRIRALSGLLDNQSVCGGPEPG